MVQCWHTDTLDVCMCFLDLRFLFSPWMAIPRFGSTGALLRGSDADSFQAKDEQDEVEAGRLPLELEGDEVEDQDSRVLKKMSSC